MLSMVCERASFFVFWNMFDNAPMNVCVVFRFEAMRSSLPQGNGLLTLVLCRNSSHNRLASLVGMKLSDLPIDQLLFFITQHEKNPTVLQLLLEELQFRSGVSSLCVIMRGA
jgi:hypothetical protein